MPPSLPCDVARASTLLVSPSLKSELFVTMTWIDGKLVRILVLTNGTVGVAGKLGKGVNVGVADGKMVSVGAGMGVFVGDLVGIEAEFG